MIKVHNKSMVYFLSLSLSHPTFQILQDLSPNVQIAKSTQFNSIDKKGVGGIYLQTPTPPRKEFLLHPFFLSTFRKHGEERENPTQAWDSTLRYLRTDGKQKKRGGRKRGV